MAEPTKNGVRVTIEFWNDNGKVTFSNVNGDFGPKGLIGSFILGSAAEKRAQELLVQYGKYPGHSLTRSHANRDGRTADRAQTCRRHLTF